MMNKVDLQYLNGKGICEDLFPGEGRFTINVIYSLFSRYVS